MSLSWAPKWTDKSVEMQKKSLGKRVCDWQVCWELSNRNAGAHLFLQGKDLSHILRHFRSLSLVCSSWKGPLFMILEYCQRGSLHRWLRRCQVNHGQLQRLSSTSTCGGESCFTLHDIDSGLVSLDSTFSSLSDSLILQFSHQIASGMAALAEQKVGLVHRRHLLVFMLVKDWVWNSVSR